MASRLKWYSGRPLTRKHLESILARAIKDEYSRKRPRGFSHLSFQDGAIKGQFIERFENTIRVEDPFGKILEFPRIDFERLEFKLSTEFPNIELVDMPRSLGVFFNQIAAYLDFKVAIVPIEVELKKWVSALEKHTETLEVTSASVRDLSISSTVSVRLTLNGSSDVREYAESFVGKRPFAFSRIQLNGLFRNHAFRCELFDDARATVLKGVEAEIIALLRDTLSGVVTPIN